MEQIETKYEGSALESQVYPELESHICTWRKQPSDAIKRKARNRCATPSAGVMLTEYYFSVFPDPMHSGTTIKLHQAALQPSNYSLWS